MLLNVFTSTINPDGYWLSVLSRLFFSNSPALPKGCEGHPGSDFPQAEESL